MATFKDCEGKNWTVKITVETIRQVRDALGVNLLDVVSQKREDHLIDRLASDPVLLVDVLYVVCKEEADKAQIDSRAFGARLAGDAVADATNALLGSLSDFFPAQRGKVLRRVLGKVGEVRDATLALAEKQLEAIKPEEIAAKLLESAGKSSTT